MSLFNIILFIVLMAAVSAFVLFFFPKWEMGSMRARTLIFSAVILFLAVDFVSKEKFSWLIPLALGTIGFIVMLRNSKA